MGGGFSSHICQVKFFHRHEMIFRFKTCCSLDNVSDDSLQSLKRVECFFALFPRKRQLTRHTRGGPYVPYMTVYVRQYMCRVVPRWIGTYTTVLPRFWPCLSSKRGKQSSGSLFARKRQLTRHARGPPASEARPASLSSHNSVRKRTCAGTYTYMYRMLAKYGPCTRHARGGPARHSMKPAGWVDEWLKFRV